MRPISLVLFIVYSGKRLATTGLKTPHAKCRELGNTKWLNKGGLRIEDWEDETHAGR